MNQLDIEQVLKQTLTDFRISRSEKKALKNQLEDWERRGQLPYVRNCAFEIAKAELIDPDSKDVIGWLEDVVKILTPSNQAAQAESTALFSPDDDCAGRICSLLKMARSCVDICVFTITDNSIAGEIVQAKRRGVKIRILTDNDKAGDLGSDIRDLRSAGVEIRTDDSPYHMHHKFAIFDQQKLLSGSYNWTRGAAKNNEENFIVTDDKDLVRSFSQQFEKLWTSMA